MRSTAGLKAMDLGDKITCSDGGQRDSYKQAHRFGIEFNDAG